MRETDIGPAFSFVPRICVSARVRALYPYSFFPALAAAACSAFFSGSNVRSQFIRTRSSFTSVLVRPTYVRLMSHLLRLATGFGSNRHKLFVSNLVPRKKFSSKKDRLWDKTDLHV